MPARAVPRPTTAPPGVAADLEADLVQYQAARLQTAAELLEEVLAENFTDHKEANLIFRDALVLFLQDVSGQLESQARGALKGKDSPGRTKNPHPLGGLGKEPMP